MSQSTLVYVSILVSAAVTYFQGVFPTMIILFHLWFIPGRFAAPLVRRLVRKQPLFFGITFQVVCLVWMLVYVLFDSTNKITELVRHRCFCCVYMLATMLAIAVMDIPCWVHTWIVAPSFFIARLTFHSVVGYWNSSMLIYGLFLVVFQLYLAKWLEEFCWRQFQAYRQLDRQRQTLEATQETLQCMLSSVWDASCSCKPDGSISSCTPHL